MKVSPDAFVQMSYQLTYHRLFGKMGSTYEACAMKKWFHGRTETIRSCSMEAKEMCEVFANKNSTDAQKGEAIRKACTKHGQIGMKAKEGKGVDRHIFGLKNIALIHCIKFGGYEMPKFFSNPILARMKNDDMSTSNCGSASVVQFGFGPVVPNGFGLGYGIFDENITISISSFEGKAQMFKEMLEKTLIEMSKVM